MDMCPICMSRYNKSVFVFGKSHGGFMAYLVNFLWRDFSRFKGLSDLISYDIALGMSSGQALIFSFLSLPLIP